MPTYNEALSNYIIQTFAIEDDILLRIRQGMANNGLPQISIKPEEGRFLQFLVASNGAKRVLEIGTLGGYSGTWIARGLPNDGKLITLEKDHHHAEVARNHFQLAGVSAKVEVREGEARKLLQDLSREALLNLIFIDAEKEEYPLYLDWALENLKKGGVVVAHNAFLHGQIVHGKDHESRVKAMRSFNNRLASDPRMISTIFPAGDGLVIGVLQA